MSKIMNEYNSLVKKFIKNELKDLKKGDKLYEEKLEDYKSELQDEIELKEKR